MGAIAIGAGPTPVTGGGATANGFGASDIGLAATGRTGFAIITTPPAGITPQHELFIIPWWPVIA